jgi:hypothetical protein
VAHNQIASILQDPDRVILNEEGVSKDRTCLPKHFTCRSRAPHTKGEEGKTSIDNSNL